MISKPLVKVGMADMQVMRGSGILKTLGLGSCVGLTMYDPWVKVAGMAHIMLPSSDISRETTVKAAKYADLAVPEMLAQLVKLGADPTRIEAKLAGGAQMFALNTKNDMMRIGPRNVEATREMLKKLSIPLVAEDTGGNYGRTIELDTETGILLVKSVNRGTKEL
jgi:chemotaxis protein CheD